MTNIVQDSVVAPTHCLVTCQRSADITCEQLTAVQHCMHNRRSVHVLSASGAAASLHKIGKVRKQTEDHPSGQDMVHDCSMTSRCVDAVTELSSLLIVIAVPCPGASPCSADPLHQHHVHHLAAPSVQQQFV